MEILKRLDQIIMEINGFSREYAKEVIKSGHVFINEKPALKPGIKTIPSCVTSSAPPMKYVSRGGYKLEAALSEFDISLANLLCIDVGASTGGFTDCMLQNGAKLVYAVDNGTNQLSDKLKTDARIISIENTDIRAFTLPNQIKADFISVDVSFISLSLIIPSIPSMLTNGGKLICLIKPQFETGGKRGITLNENTYSKVIKSIRQCHEKHNFKVIGVILSPIKGGDGNTEYLIYSRYEKNHCEDNHD